MHARKKGGQHEKVRCVCLLTMEKEGQCDRTGANGGLSGACREATCRASVDVDCFCGCSSV